MFEMNFELPPDFLEADVKKLEAQSVRVGILDKSKYAAKAKPKSAGMKNMKGIPARKIKGRDRTFPLYQLADFLDYHYGFISKAALNPENAQLKTIIEEMGKIFDGNPNPKRIENAAIALIRNPILRMDFGSNAESTIKNKGFDKPLIRTGALFSEIKAIYKEK